MSSCMTVVVYDHRLSLPYNAGTEHVGYSPSRKTLLACTRARSAGRCSASRVKGVKGLSTTVATTCGASSLALG